VRSARIIFLRIVSIFAAPFTAVYKPVFQMGLPLPLRVDCVTVQLATKKLSPLSITS
jgi:hypothetical protein